MNTEKRPTIIAFYAYKGGTGRSFALAHTAWSLAREGRRVAVVDLDLTAPSLWALFGKKPTRGVVEYMTDWRKRAASSVRTFIDEVPLDSKASGALYLLQAGVMDQAYLEALEGLDWHAMVEMPSRRKSTQLLFDFSTPFDDLFSELVEHLRPDAILLDAPTGFNDTANLCLRVLADLVVALFVPVQVHLEGIAKVVSLLTAEQHARRQHGKRPTPDVFCVASTILLSRLGGSHIRRIEDAFKYLDRVRFDVLGEPQHLDGEVFDLVQQDPAVINYDERLADLETLPTRDEPHENHFAAYHDVINYVQGALPSAVPRVVLHDDLKRKLLDELAPCFRLYAEQDRERLLESFFLRTGHVEAIKHPRVVLVLGGKGSGKTALFSYVTAKEGAIGVHGPDVGLGPDQLCAIQDSMSSMDVFWRLYVLSVLPNVNSISDPELLSAARKIARMANEPRLVSEVVHFLRVPDMAVRVLDTWKKLDGQLGESGMRFILCLDGLDAAFKADADRRERGLVDLFTAWQGTFATLKHVNLKIFLRTDLWQHLSFPEKSHLRGREMRLTWDSRDLWRMVIKRAISSPGFRHWCEQSLPTPVLSEDAVETAGERDLYPYLDRLFEHHIWAGKNSLSRNWILRRLADAKGAIYPRDLVCLNQEAIGTEKERIGERQRTTDTSVISRQSLSDALTPTSRQRVDAVCEEYPELRPVFDLLRGQLATGNLNLLSRLSEKDIAILSEAGVIRLLEEGSYLVPDLYRHGLDMPRPGPR
jgi:cellulose biosynthesis protein BcsQ